VLLFSPFSSAHSIGAVAVYKTRVLDAAQAFRGPLRQHRQRNPLRGSVRFRRRRRWRAWRFRPVQNSIKAYQCNDQEHERERKKEPAPPLCVRRAIRAKILAGLNKSPSLPRRSLRLFVLIANTVLIILKHWIVDALATPRFGFTHVIPRNSRGK